MAIMKGELLKDAGLGAGVGLLAFLLLTDRIAAALPLLLLVIAGAVIYFGGGVPGAAIRRQVGVSAHPSVQVQFDDIGGQEAAKRELLEALQFVKYPEDRRRLGIRPIRGIMLAGPPGTGKTLLAKAAATYTGSAFLAASGSEFIELYAGVGAQRVRRLFQRARRLALDSVNKSAVLFIDEIEVLAGQRGRHASHQEYDQTLNQLLVEMDGLTTAAEPAATVVVIGATNRLDLIDEALLRPGRFDRIVRVQLPDRVARRQILELHVRGKPLDDDVDLESLAQQTFGFSGAHLEALVNEAAILAWREKARRIRHRHFEEAIEKVLMGEREGRPISPAEKRRVAVHEAGHALISELVRPGSVTTVTIVSRGAALGYVRHRPADEESLWTQAQLEAAAQIALGGYVAEAIVMGCTSTGAAEDLNQLNRIIDQMIAAGMSPLGPTALNLVPPDEKYRTAVQMTRELQDKVYTLLCDRRNVLDDIVERLLVEETLDGDQLRKIINEHEKVAPEDAGVGRTGHELSYP